MEYALPGRMIDLIRDGVHPLDLKARGNRAVWSALVKTAISAQQRDWSVIEWEALITDPKSRLGAQVAIKDGRKPLPPARVQKTLLDAWDKAWTWRTDADRPEAWTKAEVTTEAHRRAAVALSIVEDPEAPLSDTERAVLAYAIDQTKVRGLLRVALPWRSVQDATGLGERATKNAMAKLTKRGFIVLEVPGRASPAAGKRRANLYALPTAQDTAPMCRGTRPMGPPHQTYGTPSIVAPMGPHELQERRSA